MEDRKRIRKWKTYGRMRKKQRLSGKQGSNGEKIIDHSSTQDEDLSGDEDVEDIACPTVVQNPECVVHVHVDPSQYNGTLIDTAGIKGISQDTCIAQTNVTSQDAAGTCINVISLHSNGTLQEYTNVAYQDTTCTNVVTPQDTAGTNVISQDTCTAGTNVVVTSQLTADTNVTSQDTTDTNVVTSSCTNQILRNITGTNVVTPQDTAGTNVMTSQDNAGTCTNVIHISQDVAGTNVTPQDTNRTLPNTAGAMEMSELSTYTSTYPSPIPLNIATTNVMSPSGTYPPKQCTPPTGGPLLTTVPNRNNTWGFDSKYAPNVLPRGLTNLGNTCYMNAALQCLGSVVPLKDYFIKNPEHHDPIASTISHMIQEMWRQECPLKAFQPIKIRNELGKCNARFSGGTQQDSQEFLIMLLEKLHDGMKAFHSVHVDSRRDENSISEAEMKWREYLNRHGDSVVADIFEGQFQSAMKCGECNKFTYKFDPLMFLSVPIPSRSKKQGKLALDDCLKHMFKEEDFAGKCWCCSGCGQKADMKRKLSISRLPDVLMIYLKRFQNDMYGGRCKINTSVEFPLRDLDLSSFMSQPHTHYKYNLFAVINHSGTIHGGHYTAYGNRDGQWYLFDDDSVRQCSKSDVKSHQAYVLFYQKEGNKDHPKSTEPGKAGTCMEYDHHEDRVDSDTYRRGASSDGDAGEKKSVVGAGADFPPLTHVHRNMDDQYCYQVKGNGSYGRSTASNIHPSHQLTSSPPQLVITNRPHCVSRRLSRSHSKIQICILVVLLTLLLTIIYMYYNRPAKGQQYLH